MSLNVQGEHSPDLLLYNANIITVDASNPKADAVLISNDRIRYVGSRDQALSLASPDLKKINLHGKTVIPGFNDNHTHAFLAGRSFQLPNLQGKTCDEIESIIRKEANGKQPGEIISGTSWDYTTCPRPHKDILDRAAPNNPVFLTQYSGHAAWVNSMMLAKLKINRDTPDPKGGQIVRDENGDPTGILREPQAISLSSFADQIKDVLVPKKHKKILREVLQNFRTLGITSVQDNTWGPFTVWHLNSFKKKGELTCRFTCWPFGYIKGLHHLMKLASYDDLWIRKGPVKYIADGAFSPRTAWLRSYHYADEPHNFGSPDYTQTEMDNIMANAARSHSQVVIHAIGDGAVHQVLNSVENAGKQYPGIHNLRIRIEHLQLVDRDDIKRMKQLGVIACIQPFSLCNPEKDVTILGLEQARTAYPFRTMLNAGIPISFGSDVPAEIECNPLLGIYYAVTRKDQTGSFGPLNPEQCFTPYEALYCYTMGSAFGEMSENEKGSITKGKLADMTVLSDDLTNVKKENIKNIEVLLTIVGGKIVYEK